MSCICRTCLSEITSNRYVDINLSEFARKQLTLCIPELNLDLVLEPVLCFKCVEALNTAYHFKSCCLQTEQRIKAHLETLTNEQQHVELDAVLGNNYNVINSMAIGWGNDINDLNTVRDHSRTRHDLEDYKDVKDVKSENCCQMSFDNDVEVNYDNFKEESIEIEEHELVFQDCNRSSQQHDVDSKKQFKDQTSKRSVAASTSSICKQQRKKKCHQFVFCMCQSLRYIIKYGNHSWHCEHATSSGMSKEGVPIVSITCRNSESCGKEHVTLNYDEWIELTKLKRIIIEDENQEKKENRSFNTISLRFDTEDNYIWLGQNGEPYIRLDACEWKQLFNLTGVINYRFNTLKSLDFGRFYERFLAQFLAKELAIFKNEPKISKEQQWEDNLRNRAEVVLQDGSEFNENSQNVICMLEIISCPFNEIIRDCKAKLSKKCIIFLVLRSYHHVLYVKIISLINVF